MPSAAVNDITINYELNGPSSSDLIVLVNGLADDLTTWSAQTPALLKAGYRVLAYDNRGIGKTSAPPGPYTADLLAQDLHGLLQALQISQGHFLGVSMGGMILQSYALRYPNGSARAKGVEMLSLALACTYAQPTEFCGRMFKLWEDMSQKMSVQDVMRDVTLWAFTVPFFRTRTDELREVERAMEGLEMSVEAYLAQLNVIQRFDTTAALEELRQNEQWLGGLDPKKTMVLAGKVDVLIPVTLSRELAERIVGSQFRTVKGGHACMWEFPDDFNRTVIEFFDEHKTKA